MKNYHSVIKGGGYFIIQIDSREKARAIQKIIAEFDRAGIEKKGLSHKVRREPFLQVAIEKAICKNGFVHSMKQFFGKNKKLSIL